MEIAKWRGLRNTTADERARNGDLDAAYNVDLDDGNALRVRRGATKVSATSSHSLFSKGGVTVVVQGQALKSLNADGSVIATLVTLTSNAPMAYAEHNGVIYYSNGTDTGRLVRGEPREWGVRNPASQPVAAATGGTLPNGAYQYAITYVRRDGLESGSPTPGVITLTDIGGISLSSIQSSSDPQVEKVAVYVSGPNGAELYRRALLPVSAGSWTFYGGYEGGPALSPDLVSPAPAGTVLEVHGGAMYVAQGNVAWASDLFSMEQFRFGRRFIQMPQAITMMASVGSGMYVGTADEIWYGDGPGIGAMAWRRVGTFGAIPGTMAKFDSAGTTALEEEAASQTPIAYFLSRFGVIMASPGGQLSSLTSGKYNFPSAIQGACIMRMARGYETYLVAVAGAGADTNVYD